MKWIYGLIVTEHDSSVHEIYYDANRVTGWTQRPVDLSLYNPRDAHKVEQQIAEDIGRGNIFKPVKTGLDTKLVRIMPSLYGRKGVTI